ncbi:hypothetical protein C8Q78DRAFT_1026125 [Trametes maxima]|nr:hypothetical protein C8Q78DRAFT_1026125 [Trametes maxima]
MHDASASESTPDAPQANQQAPAQVVHRWEITATYTGPETSHAVPPWLFLPSQGMTAPRACACLCHCACSGATVSPLQHWPWPEGGFPHNVKPHVVPDHNHPAPAPTPGPPPCSPSRSRSATGGQSRRRPVRTPSDILSYASAPRSRGDRRSATLSSRRSRDDASPSRTLSSSSSSSSPSPSRSASPARPIKSPKDARRPRKKHIRCK